MEILDVTDEGIVTMNLTDEELSFFVGYAVNDMIRKGMEGDILKQEFDKRYAKKISFWEKTKLLIKATFGRW